MFVHYRNTIGILLGILSEYYWDILQGYYWDIIGMLGYYWDIFGILFSIYSVILFKLGYCIIRIIIVGILLGYYITGILLGY